MRFGTFELNVGAGELPKQGFKIPPQEQPLRILQMILANPGGSFTGTRCVPPFGQDC